MLTGGGANLRNIDKFISSKVKFPTHIPPNPEDCVAIGTGKVASNTPGLTKISLMGYHNL